MAKKKGSGAKGVKSALKEKKLKVRLEGESIGQASRRMNKAARQASLESARKTSLAKGYFKEGGEVEKYDIGGIITGHDMFKGLRSRSAQGRSKIYREGGKVDKK